MDVSNSDNRADYDCLSRFMLLRRKIADWARGAISLPPKQDCYQVCSWVETAYADLSCLGGLNCVFFFNARWSYMVQTSHHAEMSCSLAVKDWTFHRVGSRALSPGGKSFKCLLRLFDFEGFWLSQKKQCGHYGEWAWTSHTVEHLQLNFPRAACYSIYVFFAQLHRFLSIYLAFVLGGSVQAAGLPLAGQQWKVTVSGGRMETESKPRTFFQRWLSVSIRVSLKMGYP